MASQRHVLVSPEWRRTRETPLYCSRQHWLSMCNNTRGRTGTFARVQFRVLTAQSRTTEHLSRLSDDRSYVANNDVI